MSRHVLPNLLAQEPAAAMTQIGHMVTLESGLGLFGITGTAISAGRKQ